MGEEKKEAVNKDRETCYWCSQPTVPLFHSWACCWCPKCEKHGNDKNGQQKDGFRMYDPDGIFRGDI